MCLYCFSQRDFRSRTKLLPLDFVSHQHLHHSSRLSFLFFFFVAQENGVKEGEEAEEGACQAKTVLSGDGKLHTTGIEVSEGMRLKLT